MPNNKPKTVRMEADAGMPDFSPIRGKTPARGAARPRVARGSSDIHILKSLWFRLGLLACIVASSLLTGMYITNHVPAFKDGKEPILATVTIILVAIIFTTLQFLFWEYSKNIGVIVIGLPFLSFNIVMDIDSLMRIWGVADINKVEAASILIFIICFGIEIGPEFIMSVLKES